MTGAVSMRDAVSADLDALLRWRNDPLTCANFHNHLALSAATLQKWLADALRDGRVSLRIAERDGSPVGVLRVDHDGAVMIIVAPEARGHGIAGAMLAFLPNRQLFAEIRETNMASRRAFESAGFTQNGSRCGMLVYRRAPIGSAPPRF